jgi:transposase
MTVNRAYKRTSVNQVELSSLLETAARIGSTGKTVVGLDISKSEIVARLRWNDSSVERPWSVKNPLGIDDFVELLRGLKPHVASLIVGLESTGTYGEAVRRKLTLAEIEVHRLSGKAVSDYKEVFDGVPSQHDGKDAAVIAELTAFGKGTPWPFVEAPATIQAMKHQVARLVSFRDHQVRWLGRLEGLLAEHWPELTGLLELGGVTMLSLLKHYRGPAAVAADAEAANRLRGWGRSKLTNDKIARVIESAGTTCGVPIDEFQSRWLSEVADEALSALREVRACEKELSRLVEADVTLRRYAQAVGAATLAVILVTVGDPRNYGSGGALLKALGVNLKELSSGRRMGELAITKRGPAQARQWLFLWALRAVQRTELKSWYEEFIQVGKRREGQRSSEHRKMKGIVAMMRKLPRGLRHAMVHEEDFDYAKLLAPPARTSPSRRRRLRRRAAKRRAAVANPSETA